jgi:phosphoadenosine phosphosulfate reductase
VIDKFVEASDILHAASKESDSCIVFFSGGKDSLVVMDMAVQTFEHVVGVFMYFVPGLSVIENSLSFARQRWGIEIVQIPHWILFRCIKNGIYGFPRSSNDNIPDIKIKDIYLHIISQTGIKFIATGAKAADSVWRKQNLATTKDYQFLLTPLKNWNKFDVLYYLKTHNIPLPDGDGNNKTISGIDLTENCIMWLYEKHHEDFELLESYFPFVGAIPARKRIYGSGSAANRKK